MAGKGKAVTTGNEVRDTVAALGARLGLHAQIEAKVGRRLWGAVRFIDVVLTHPETRISLGVECKAQSQSGSAEEKIPTTIRDIDAWPIRGIVVIHGEGFSANMRSFLYSTGKAVDLDDLEGWLRLYFGLMD